MIVERRSIIKGLVALLAAPAIVKVASIMPVKAALQPEVTLTLEDYAARVIEPAVRRLESQYAHVIITGNGSLRLGDWITWEAAENGRELRQFRVTALSGRDAFLDESANDDYQARGQLIVAKNAHECLAPLAVDLAPIALVAAAVAVAPQVLATPITRRFWARS